MMKKIVVLIALATPVHYSLASQQDESRQLDDIVSAKIGTNANVKKTIGDLNLAIKIDVDPVPIPNAEHAVWWVVKGQNLLEQKGVETFAKPGEIVVCSERMGDCTMRYRVKIETEINLTSAAAQMKGQRFDGQMLRLAELARRSTQISVTNEAGRLILRSQQ